MNVYMKAVYQSRILTEKCVMGLVYAIIYPVHSIVSVYRVLNLI